MVTITARKVFYVITGASKGLGRAIAVSLANKDRLFNKHMSGSVMVLVARKKDGLEETAAIVKKANCDDLHVRVVQADLGNITKLEQVTEKLLQAPDSSETYTNAVLINNAGSVGDVTKKLVDLANLEMIRDYFDFNVTSAIFLTSRFHQKFISSSVKKTVVNISSKRALEPMPYTSLYCVSKAARDMSHKMLACENQDTRVLNYAPGPLETDMATEIQEKTGNDEYRRFFIQLRNEKKIIDPYDTTKKMIKILKEDRYRSGDHIDYYDVD